MVLRMEGDTVYYTTPQAKKQAGNAGNAREKPGIIDRTTADFLPGACRTEMPGGVLILRCECFNIFRK